MTLYEAFRSALACDAHCEAALKAERHGRALRIEFDHLSLHLIPTRKCAMQIEQLKVITDEFVRGLLPPDRQGRIQEFRRIMGAVLIQDMRTRFGHSHLGYLIAIAWPFCHLAVLTLAFLLRNQVAPVGDSPTMFVATGIVPYILCLYPARLMALAIVQNRQLLNIPIIQPLHLILSRCVLETLNALVVLSLFLSVIYLFDVDIFPFELIDAAIAVAAAVFLGIGLGFLNVAMCALFGQFFLLFFMLIMLTLYIFSGVYVPTSAMPDNVREYMQYNPLLHLVEWVRSAYYASYDTEQINKTLVVGLAGITLIIGLAGERLLRGKFLS
jgi:capsular polysaccharide transport system permease protein